MTRELSRRMLSRCPTWVDSAIWEMASRRQLGRECALTPALSQRDRERVEERDGTRAGWSRRVQGPKSGRDTSGTGHVTV